MPSAFDGQEPFNRLLLNSAESQYQSPDLGVRQGPNLQYIITIKTVAISLCDKYIPFDIWHNQLKTATVIQ